MENGSLDEVLNLSALAKRVGISYQKIAARKRRSDFSSWSSQHDPDGHQWSYCSDRNAFRASAS